VENITGVVFYLQESLTSATETQTMMQ